MQRVTWYALLALVALVAPIVGRAQGPLPPAPQATVRELATIEGEVWEWVLLPSRRTLIYTSQTSPSRIDDSTFAYDIATKRRTLLGTNMVPGGVSPQGDRLAFNRSSEEGTGDFVWTMPIDPKTGVATGQAQRVSLRSSTGRPKFSPDGKMLVFRAGPRPDGTGTATEVIIVPATGGAERVVASYPARVGSYAWSADGKSLHVECPTRNPPTVIFRVPVEGGRSEPLVPWTLITNEQPVGLSPDASVAFIHSNPDRFFYRTASGVEGEISVALPPPYDEGDVLNMRLESMRFSAMTQAQNQGVRVLDLTTGQARQVLPGNVQSSSPAWSPDGRRLAVLSGNLSHYDITVVNADGSSPRRYPVPVHLDGWWFPPSPDRLVWENPWSPDGRFLAFRANRATDGQKVGYSPYDQYQLAILDVNSGQTRVLITSPGTFGKFVWRSDGNAIRTLKRTFVAIGSLDRVSIVEIALKGTERTLRDISAEFPRANDVVFTSDRTAVVRVATDQGPERFIVPLDGGAARRLPDPGAEPGTRIGSGTLVAGNRLLVGQIDARGEARVIKIISTVRDATRALPIPFNGHHGVAHPDGKQIINVGKVAGDAVWKLFLVPLDGSPTRLIGEIPRGTGGLLAPSPDGKLLAYTSEGPVTSKIFEIDLGPAFQAIVKR